MEPAGGPWGISGLTLVILYAVGFAATSLFVLLRRRKVWRGVEALDPITVRRWHPCDVALLTSTDLAVSVSLLDLLQRRIITIDAPYADKFDEAGFNPLRSPTSETRQLWADTDKAPTSTRICLAQRPTDDLHPIEVEICRCLAEEAGGLAPAVLLAHLDEGSDLVVAAVVLTERVTPQARTKRSIRVLALAWIPMAVGCLAGLQVGIDQGRSIEGARVGLVGIGVGVWFTMSVPTYLPSIGRSMNELNRTFVVAFDASARVSRDAVMGTALFGSSVFWSNRPGLAASLGLPLPGVMGWRGVASTPESQDGSGVGLGV